MAAQIGRPPRVSRVSYIDANDCAEALWLLVLGCTYGAQGEPVSAGQPVLASELAS